MALQTFTTVFSIEFDDFYLQVEHKFNLALLRYNVIILIKRLHKNAGFLSISLGKNFQRNPERERVNHLNTTKNKKFLDEYLSRNSEWKSLFNSSIIFHIFNGANF